jgi:hypothetical protein
MLSTSLYRWIGSRFAFSWQLMLLVFANYVLNGQLFTGVELVSGGPAGYVFDLYNSLSVISVLVFFRFIKFKNTFTKSITAFTIASAISNFVPVIALPYLYSTVDANSENYRSFLLIATTGFFQMILVQSLLTILLASFSESRIARKKIAIEQTKLNHLRENYQTQLAEITQRLEVDVRSKLDELLSNLLSKIESHRNPKQLASLVGETLNEGVRPLSWEIESDPDEDIDLSKVKPIKFSLRERFAFKVELSKATSVASATFLLAIYDLPLILFVFGMEAVPQGIVTIAISATGMLFITRLLAKNKIYSWLAVILMGLIAGLLGSSFLFIRLLSEGLSAEFYEIGVVISFAQIYLAVTWFKTTIELRAFSIGRVQELNEQLKVLVSTLRQSTWLQKQKLARMVHGPVQSSLFAVYLELNQADSLTDTTRGQLAEKVGAASQALDLPNESVKLPFSKALAQLTEGWGDTLEFKVWLDPEVARRIDSSEVGKACAIETLREAINNAAKYGTGNVEISIDSVADKLVSIQVRNGIAVKSLSAAPGYGSSVLDQVTHQWELKTEGDQAIFTGLVALSK